MNPSSAGKLVNPTATEGRILSAATGLFARFGYRGTTTQQIALSAQVNEATIYRHYGSKENLYCAVIQSGLKSIDLTQKSLDILQSASCREDAMSHAVDVILAILEPKREWLRLILFGAMETSPVFERMLRDCVLDLAGLVAGHLQVHFVAGELKLHSLKGMVLLVAAVLAFESSLGRALPEHFSLVSCLQGLDTCNATRPFNPSEVVHR
jgi:AcrR family transcriptional regulator